MNGLYFFQLYPKKVKRLNKKAQVLVVGVWVLVILSLLALSIGYRVSLSLRVSQYYRDRLKAKYLAYAGIRRAMIEIINDSTVSYDTPSDRWANNEVVFKEIKVDGNPREYASVAYTVLNDGREEACFGVRDEERKININTAPEPVLASLFQERGIGDAENLAHNVIIWRGDIPDNDKIYENQGFPCKGKKFTNTLELILIKDFTQEDYSKAKDLITVFGDGRLNINMACEEAMAILLRGLAKELNYQDTAAQTVLTKVIELRRAMSYFKDRSDLDAITWTGDEEVNLFNALMSQVVYASDNFLIEVVGHVGKIQSKVTAVYSHLADKILFWHEG